MRRASDEEPAVRCLALLSSRTQSRLRDWCEGSAVRCLVLLSFRARMRRASDEPACRRQGTCFCLFGVRLVLSTVEGRSAPRIPACPPWWATPELDAALPLRDSLAFDVRYSHAPFFFDCHSACPEARREPSRAFATGVRPARRRRESAVWFYCHPEAGSDSQETVREICCLVLLLRVPHPSRPRLLLQRKLKKARRVGCLV